MPAIFSVFRPTRPKSIARDIEIIKQELPIDILEFFFLTPLPGSEDHKKLLTRGVPMDPDMNKYDLEHACTERPLMSQESWECVYADAWRQYYTDEHIEKVMRRAIVAGVNHTKLLDSLILFSGAARIEGVHPLQFGYVRRKVRTQRRHGMPIVNSIAFYPWRAYDAMSVAGQWMRRALRYRRILRRVVADPGTYTYFDEAMQPATGEGVDHFVEIFADEIPKTHGAPPRRTAEFRSVRYSEVKIGTSGIKLGQVE